MMQKSICILIVWGLNQVVMNNINELLLTYNEHEAS